MSDKLNDDWLVEVELDYANQSYTVGRIVKYKEIPWIMRHDDRYTIVTAADEIGAFNQTQKTMSRLGFRIGA